MAIKVKGRVKAIAWLLCLAYFASYVMRINLSVMITEVYTSLGKTKDDVAIILTALTITYGLGQIFCGVLGDKLKPRLILTIGFMIAISCNIAIFFAKSIVLMAIIWAINGLGHAMFWPPIVKLMAQNLTEAEYSYASVRVTWGSSIATILLYLSCPFMLIIMSWRTIMLICAIVGAIIMAVWIILYPKLFGGERSMLDDLKAPKEKGVKPPKYVFLPLILIMIAIVMQGALRDGVTAWMPAYLVEEFSIPSKWSILITVVLAIFSMISFTLFDYMNTRFFRNEIISAIVIFGIAIVSAVLLFITNLFEIAIPSILFMSILVACMHGTNLMLIAFAPKRFKRSGKVSTYSGIMNACTYIGAAISTYGFAKISELFGWGVTIIIWIGVALVGAILCLIALPKWTKFRKEYDRED